MSEVTVQIGPLPDLIAFNVLFNTRFSYEPFLKAHSRSGSIHR